MRNSIDQSTDYSCKELYQFLTGVSIPSFVKEASLDEIKDAGPMAAKVAYADQLNRLFPINSRARVYVSNAYFVNKKAELEKLQGKAHVAKVASAIKLAAQTFGIEKEIEEYSQRAFEKLASDYSDQSITFKIDTDEFDLFTIKTAADVQRESENFAGNINKYPFEWRRNVAEQFVKVAEIFDLDELPDLVLKYAGQYYPDITNVKSEIARRATKLSGENKERYTKLAEDISNASSVEEFFKLAECFHYTEKNAGLYDKPGYRKLLGDPVDKLFTLHAEKVASIVDVVEMGGEKFASADLAQVPADVYHQAFGFDLDPKSAEAKEILPTMPKSDVSLFKQLSGVQPI